MMRSMSSAVSSLRNHQLRMDVIGNNIANVNTVGYKASRATFKDAMLQNMRGASGPSDISGGTNPQQVGLGMNISSIDTLFGQGPSETTGMLSDVMINGDGFFMISQDGSPEGVYYTRAGNFTTDGIGNLVNPDGMRVMGYAADQDGNIVRSISPIVIPKADTFPPKITSEVIMEGNLDSSTKSYDQLGGTIGTYVGSGALYEEIPAGSSKYKMNAKYADAVAMETVIYGYDSLGGKNEVKLSFVKTGTNTFDIVGFELKPDGTMTKIGDKPISIKFDENGNLTGAPDSFKLKFSKMDNGAADLDLTVKLDRLKQFAAVSDVAMKEQDGYTVGTLSGFEIGSDGKVLGKFSNGQKKLFGQITTSVFSNPAGLNKAGNSLFESTLNSGDPQINIPGAGSNGKLMPGALEMSGVDLGVEFTSMITTQRGFQANSRTISTTDQMLEELVNLKR